MFMAGGETTPTNRWHPASMTMAWILINIPLGVAMVAVAAGLPALVMWKFPEGDDAARAQTTEPQTSARTSPAGRNIYQRAAENYSRAAA